MKVLKIRWAFGHRKHWTILTGPYRLGQLHRMVQVLPLLIMVITIFLQKHPILTTLIKIASLIVPVLILSVLLIRP